MMSSSVYLAGYFTPKIIDFVRWRVLSKLQLGESAAADGYFSCLGGKEN
jgi:hypothetical protein